MAGRSPAALITAVLAMAVPVTAETVAVPVTVGLETAAKAVVQVTVGLETAAKVVVPVTVGLETAAKVVVPVTVDLIAAVQVVAAARVIPAVTNLEVVAKVRPQSHQRNSLL